jgi:endonuclease III related protein
MAKKGDRVSGRIRDMYGRLERRFGDLGWWPARSRFEVIVGAVLTQNTSWKNVEEAIRRLKSGKLMDLQSMLAAKESCVREAVRCTGYYKQKTKSLKGICLFLMSELGRDLRKSRLPDTEVLREKLLSLRGIGPETADSILLYAFKRPVFVVDAYTIRIFERHGLINGNKGYVAVQSMVHDAFGRNHEIFNRFHALLVETGKCFCIKREGRCEKCPLKGL